MGSRSRRIPASGRMATWSTDDGKELKRGHGFDGDPVSNNHAEYAGLVEALKFVKLRSQMRRSS
jgi:ribonuclease HI